MSAPRRARRIPANSATSVTWSTSTSPPPLSQSGFRAEQRTPGATRPRPSAGNTPGAVAASGVLAAGLPGPLGTLPRPGNDLSPAALWGLGHLAAPDPPLNSPRSPAARLRSRPAPAPQAVPPPGPKINGPINVGVSPANATAGLVRLRASLQTPPRGDALAFRQHFTFIRLCGGFSPQAVDIARHTRKRPHLGPLACPTIELRPRRWHGAS